MKNKTAEKILKSNWNKNPNNESLEDMYEGQTKAILSAMEEYASQFKPKWIKIESEEDLPKDGIVIIGSSKKGMPFSEVRLFLDKLIDRNYVITQWKRGYISHFMIVEAPQPPKED